MDKPILYYWAPCTNCAPAVQFAEQNHIELDLRDVEQEEPYNELLALGGDANKIPYLYHDEQLIEGQEAVIAYIEKLANDERERLYREGMKKHLF